MKKKTIVLIIILAIILALGILGIGGYLGFESSPNSRRRGDLG